MDARPWQFSIRQAMVATALVAGACGVARFVVGDGEPVLRGTCILVVPVLLGAAVGVLAGRVHDGLAWGIACDFAIAAVWLISAMAG